LWEVPLSLQCTVTLQIFMDLNGHFPYWLSVTFTSTFLEECNWVKATINLP